MSNVRTFIHAGASRLSGASAPAKFYPPPPRFWRRLDWPVSEARGRGGLLALLLVLAAAALLLVFSAGPATAQSSATTDYDVDNDNLIDVSTLAQLNAMRWDLDGNGVSTNVGYATAFPNPAAGMGCQATCAGYELEADLDFNTDTSTDVSGEAVIDDQDDYWNGGAGWEPIGTDANARDSERYNAVFDGNGHTISNLFINGSGSYVGLFGAMGTDSEIRRVGLESVDVTGSAKVGGLVGLAHGDIRFTYTTGSVTALQEVGGLVGVYNANGSALAASYSTASVTGRDQDIGGLVGEITGGEIRASYASGAVDAGEVGSVVGGLVGDGSSGATITASYATGAVSIGFGEGPGGLAASFDDLVKDSYWDAQTSGQNASAGGTRKTTQQLQSPTVYGGIYANWNIDVDDDGRADDPWDFGTASQYPALHVDFDGDGRATAYEFGRQGRSALVDYDADDNGLIEVNSLAQLNANRWDLNGDGTATLGNQASYGTAFPDAVAGMGCKLGDHDDQAATADQPICTGYELTADLDFNTNTTTDVSGEAVIDSSDDYWNGGAGWDPIGTDSAPFMATFEGNKRTIDNLFINRPTVTYLGLFAQTYTPAEIRYLRLTNVNVTGKHDVGALVGHMSAGKVSYSSSGGSVTAAGHNGALSIGDSKVGGLVGSTVGGSSVVSHSYSTAGVSGVGNYAGGLVGSNGGAIIASYATGAVTGGQHQAGGLAGNNSGSITASYATGAVEGENEVGGLAGNNGGTITASYATGAVSSDAIPAGSDLGGLVGRDDDTVTNSYWDTTTSGQAGGAGKTTSELQTPTAYGSSPSIYADWNVNTDGVAGADDPWDFGTASQYPALKADFDGDGTPTPMSRAAAAVGAGGGLRR